MHQHNSHEVMNNSHSKPSERKNLPKRFQDKISEYPNVQTNKPKCAVNQ